MYKGMMEYEEDEDIKYGPPTKKKPGEKENELPLLNDEKPMIGPNINGSIRVMYRSAIDGFAGPDSEEMAAMEKMNLPTGFEFGRVNTGQSKAKLITKQQKKTYWCDVCSIELNSEDTMMSHMRGAKHMKKSLAKSMPENPIRPISNPAPTRKKQPVRLQQKIIETNHKIVGLTFIREFIACSNSEMEPHYECSLCETQGMSNCMFQHLIGQSHRQKYVDNFHNDDPKWMDLTQQELLRFAEEHNENNDRLYNLIETRYSDDVSKPNSTLYMLINYLTIIGVSLASWN